MIAGLSFRITLIFAATGCATTFTTSTVRAAPGDIYSLGTLNGGTASYATSINDAGQVAGWGWWSTQTQGVDRHAFRYDWTAPGTGTLRDLGTLGGRHSEGAAIDNTGRVAGYSDTHYFGNGTDAFIYSGTPSAGGQMTDLGALGWYATGLSPSGSLLVGQVDYNSSQGFVTQLSSGGSFQSLSFLPWAVNDAGQIVGGGTSAVRYDPISGGGGVKRSLGSLGGDLSNALAINKSGQVAGYSKNAAGQRHAFRYDGTPGAGGAMVDLGTVAGRPESIASAINDSGFVVGYATDPVHQSGSSAALWTPDGTAIDLDAWLDSVNPTVGARWFLDEARDINNAGLIAGNGEYIDEQGAPHILAFVLDASSLVPEPSTISLVLLGAALVSNSNVVRRRERLAVR